MGEQIKNTSNELKERWKQKMPRFFKRLMTLCVCIAGTALGVNQVMEIGHAQPHEWWTDVYPLLLSVPTGMAIVCKLTVAGGYKDIDTDKLTGHNPLLNGKKRKDEEKEDKED